MLFFFKQKTAYEMRISDWSSDVCSSDLIGVMACISIVDDAGDLKAFLRMDGAAKLALDISQNKAFTAVSFGMSTDQWWEFIKDDAPLLHGITHTPRLTVFGGGYPIREGDHVIGGIGVSGGDRKRVVWGKSVSVRVDLG